MKTKYRTIWISDVHLGTRGCQADHLLDFLNNHSCEKLYLVGDIIDGWVMSRGNVYWPQQHTNVIRKVLSKAKNGTDVIYVSGNHDEFLRSFPYDSEFGLQLGNIKVVDQDTHITADGRRLLVIHGDQFDIATRYYRSVAILGDYGYRLLIWANRWFNKLRKYMKKDYWSLSAAIKRTVKSAVSYIGKFEHAVSISANEENFDGVVCGHIHHAEIKQINNITYHNCGDWVESCTALAEDFDGNINIILWAKVDHS